MSGDTAGGALAAVVLAACGTCTGSWALGNGALMITLPATGAAAGAAASFAMSASLRVRMAVTIPSFPCGTGFLRPSKLYATVRRSTVKLVQSLLSPSTRKRTTIIGSLKRALSC